MPELDDADKAVLIALLKATIAADRFPMSLRIRRFKAILAKLYPPPEPPGEPSAAFRKMRRR